MRPKREPYTCPRCGYSTSHKTNIKNHFYNTKSVCPATKAVIDLTDNVKQHILDNRIYTSSSLK